MIHQFCEWLRLKAYPTLIPVEEHTLINIEYTYIFDNIERDAIKIYTQLYLHVIFNKEKKNQLNLKKRKNSIAYIY